MVFEGIYILDLKATAWVNLIISPGRCAASNHDLWQMLRKRQKKGSEHSDDEFGIVLPSQNQMLWTFGDERCIQTIMLRCHLSSVQSVYHF